MSHKKLQTASTPAQGIQRRHLIGSGAAGAIWAMGLPAQAQADFPNRPIKIVVPYSAGTGSDALARTVAQGITDKTGKPVIVENREGGGARFVLSLPKFRET